MRADRLNIVSFSQFDHFFLHLLVLRTARRCVRLQLQTDGETWRSSAARIWPGVYFRSGLVRPQPAECPRRHECVDEPIKNRL